MPVPGSYASRHRQAHFDWSRCLAVRSTREEPEPSTSLRAGRHRRRYGLASTGGYGERIRSHARTACASPSNLVTVQTRRPVDASASSATLLRSCDYSRSAPADAAAPHSRIASASRRCTVSPPLPEQQTQIARTIFGSIDDLIENNRRRVEVLEEMARAIYREWFVNFRYPGHEDVPLVDSALGPIPEGWAVGDYRRRLLEIVKYGQGPQGRRSAR